MPARRRVAKRIYASCIRFPESGSYSIQVRKYKECGGHTKSWICVISRESALKFSVRALLMQLYLYSIHQTGDADSINGGQ